MIKMKNTIDNAIRKAFGQNPLEGYLFYNGKNRLDKIERFHLIKMKNNDQADWMVDDVTWNDLEMDEVYLRINHTNSFLGEQYLYHKLHDLRYGKDEKEEKELEERLEFYTVNPEKRIEVERHLYQVGKREEGYYLFDFLADTNQWTIGSPWLYHVLQLLLVLFAILGFGFGFKLAQVGLLMTVVVNLGIYMFIKGKYDVYFTSLIEFKKVYDCAKWMSSHLAKDIALDEQVVESIKKLDKMSKVIISLDGRRQAAIAGDVIALANEYIWGVFLIDVSVFNYIMKIIEDKREDVVRILEFLGEMDAEISIASYRESVDCYCKPSFYGDSNLVVKGIAHPLLSHPQTNDWTLNHRAIITGTNASGKSTFMKSIAINCILAQTIHTCSAEEMKLMPMHVVTCMALRDDILTGESYYYREAKCLKRMIDVANEGPVLFLIDEILKGTNTEERVAASKAILEYLGKAKCFIIVATHDSDLTKNDMYENYHFTSQIEGKQVIFDYKIHEGRSNQSNAIALLDCLGYPEEIISKARENICENWRNSRKNWA